jgi:hypothetical protein
MDLDQLKQAVADVQLQEEAEQCELIEGAALEACSGGGIPWIKWSMAFK